MKYSKNVSDTCVREVKKKQVRASWRFKKEKKNLRQAETRVAFCQAPRLNKPHVYQNSTGPG